VKKLLLFSTLLLLVAATNAQTNKLLQPSKRTIITGKFNDIPTARQTVELSGRNAFGEIDLVEFVSQTDGSFKFSINLNFPQELYLESRNQIKILLTPGDSLYIEFTKGFDVTKYEELSKYIAFSGNRAQLNLDLLSYNRSESDSTYRVDCENESPAQFLQTVAKHQQIAETALANYIEKYMPSQEFIDYQTAAKKYRYANDLLGYKFCLFTKGLQKEGNVYDNNLFPVNNDKALISNDYSTHLINYTYNYFQTKKTKQILETMGTYAQYKYVLDSIYTREKQGLSKDMMLLEVMNSCLETDKEVFLRLSADYKQLLSNAIVTEKIERMVALAKIPSTNQNVYAGQDEAIQDSVDQVFSEIGKQFKGKLVYVDIWATSCSPCRAEMPASLKLRDYFAGKDVAFVYICLESTKPSWEKVIKDMKIEGNHYLLNKEQSSIFRKRYATKGVPHFMLIGKDGAVLKGETTSPSQELTYKTIEELLKRGV